jgi:RNA polymerase subunit RPABC4/transcription elongation factor Spt4
MSRLRLIGRKCHDCNQVVPVGAKICPWDSTPEADRDQSREHNGCTRWKTC